ncbi:site-specific DNA-methyltransferase, partial [Candidatus Acetothermia bacterium]
MSEVARQKFQNLLRELFQFDLADLDFGIYRIMNHKRQVIERWIVEDLPKAVEEELRRGALAEQAQAQQALEGARQKVVETLGREALDAEGNLAEQFAGTKVGREYLEARERAAHAQPSEALEAAIYNHLYTFFSRYYQDGDFISKRRYSKRQKYAIPYNGEEVYLYWANHDQYYIKTAEHFTDYTWKAPGGVTVHFKLQAADVEVNNVKGEKRFFLPALDGMAWDAETRTLTIPFHYRPLTEQEKITYGNKNQQEKILEEAMQAIPARLQGNTEALAALTAERRKDAKGNPVSYLEHHLRQYTARNTRDFFIHKDLRGFLARELDFYIKNEVLNLEELEAAGEDLAEGWFQLMRLIKRIGNHIIDFLAQIEDFQKTLWEKKKFITETFWCITVGHIPEEFYPEIAENEAQWEEWKELFHIDGIEGDMFSGDIGTEEGRIAFLKAHPSLVLDTRHFSPDFTDRLLASFENLDELTDGLLVHGENFQVLSLLQTRYKEQISCIY